MSQTAIPFLFFRGGTSRGPYMLRSDLPKDRQQLESVLVSIVGSGHPLNIDGIGGGVAVTTKVAMLSRSHDDWADVDYFFGQVSVQDRLVDFGPTCGNILVGVGPAAIEMGLVKPQEDTTEVRIRAVNTGARVTSVVSTPDKTVTYEGDTAIDGVPGTSASVELKFMDIVGGTTGAMFPTGSRFEKINGAEVSCVDAAMPMVIARASDLGISGYEPAAELSADKTLMNRIEAIRVIAGKRMGMGDVRRSVAPKFGLVAPPREGGTLATRYFMPWDCHPSLAVTGSQCLATCVLAGGTVCDGLTADRHSSPARLLLEHPAGTLEVVVEFERKGVDFSVLSCNLVRTARKLAEGRVFVPRSIWRGH